MFIKIQTSPLLEQIEQGDRKSETHLEIRPNSLPQMFQFTNLREQRKDSFNHHSVVPLAAPTDFQVFRLSGFAPKAFVCKNNHFAGNRFDQRQKLLVGNVRRFNLPIGNQSEFVGEQAQFSADNSFPRSKTFASDTFAMGLMILSNRMTQLDAVRVDDAENGRFRQKLFRQPAMRFKSAKKPCSLRQIGKQIFPILSEPSIKSVLRAAFESHQQAERNKFADRKFGLKVFSRFRQHIIYTTKKFYDKVFLSHGFVSPCIWFGHLYNRNLFVTFSTSTIG